jgi:MoaA/NifB/PqqE/SkfB family radical SAM enzyme
VAVGEEPLAVIRWLHFPLFIKWYVTGVCNLRCSHCYLTDYTKEPPLDFCIAIARYLVAKGVVHVSLLGGEPLVRTDLEQIVNVLSDGGIKVKIATNGTMIDSARAKSLVAAGATDFQVSLEGHSTELNDQIRGKGTLRRILEAVANLKSAGARVALGLTISRCNAAYIDEIFYFAMTAGIDQLKLSAFVPIGTGKLAAPVLLLDRAMVLTVRSRLIELCAAHPELAVNSVFLPRQNDNCSRCQSTFGCGAGTNSLVINQDLTISACDILVEEDKTSRKIAKPEDIQDFWTNELVFAKWRGITSGRTISVSSFTNVHQMGCHVSATTYQEDLFA